MLYFRVLLIFLSSLLFSFSPPHDDICVCALAGGGGGLLLLRSLIRLNILNKIVVVCCYVFNI